MPPRAKKPKSDQEGQSDPAYVDKRKRNNEAVKKSRDKSKKKAEETMKRVQKLKDDNKKLEGKIDEQRKTKKFLKDLFINQTTSKESTFTPEQLKLIGEEDSEDNSGADDDSLDDSESNSEESESESSEPQPSRKRNYTKRK